MPVTPRSGALMESVSRKGRTRRGIIVAVAVGLILVAGLAIGLGVGLGRRKYKDDSTAVSTMDAASTDAAIRDRTVGGSVATTPSTGGTTIPTTTPGNTTGITNGNNAPTTPTTGSTPAVNSTGTTTAANSTGTTPAVNSTDAAPAVNATLPVVPTNPPPSPPPPVTPPPPTPPPPATPPLPVVPTNPPPSPPPPPATPPLPAEEAGNENCDKFIPNADVAGTDMPGSGVGTASNEACLNLCKTTPNCNTVVRLGSGQCFMKSLDEDAAPFARNGVTSYIICSALNPPPMVLPPSAEEKELQQYFSTGTQCPPEVAKNGAALADGIAYPQWTGRAESIIGVPTPIQKLYEDLNDGFYNAATKKYTLQFTPLPADLTYCTEGTTTVENACKAPKGATNTLQQCFATDNVEQWTFNSGTGKCEPFAYNGCGGNANQFKSQSLCQAACETPIKATMGGTITFSKGDGKCSLPPTKPDGSPCCTMKFWQPNYAGYYYDNCSVQRDVGSDGLFYFKTEIPGSELSAEWGPDPEPHIHYDMLCSGCAPNEFFTGDYRYWNKFYPEGACDLKSCWGNNKIHLAPGPEHQAQKSEVVKGELRYTYHMTLPAQDDPNGIDKLIG